MAIQLSECLFSKDYKSFKEIENKANKELIEFCSKFFGVNKSKLKIVSGDKSKLKKILIQDSSFEVISQKLMFVLNSLQKDNKG